MARQKSKERVEAQYLWGKSGRTAKLKDIADKLGVPEGQVRKWKCMDKWDAFPGDDVPKIKGNVPEFKRNVAKSKNNVTDISTRCRRESQPPVKGKAGPPIGNQNAAGHGAPEGNANAVTHGLYQAVANMYFDADDRDLFEAAKTVGGIQDELAIARLKLARLIREQERRNNSRLQGTMGSAFGPTTYKLKDDFFEDAINKALVIIARLENNLRKATIEEERLKLAKRQMDILEKRYGDGGDEGTVDDGFFDALNNAGAKVWADEKGEEISGQAPGAGDS